MDWKNLESLFKRRSLPMILQTEVTECGLASLAMIANYYGHHTDLIGLRMRYPVSSRGLHLGHLMEIAGDLQLDSRPVRVDLEDMKSLDLPCILHWDMNHFVVCKAVDKKRVYIHDPGIGVRSLSFAEVSKSFTGVALEVFPRNDFAPVTIGQKVHLSQFWTRLVGVEKSLFLLLLVSFALLILTLLTPFLSMLVLDEVITSHDISLLNLLGIAFAIIATFYAGANFLRDYLVLYIGSQFTQQMSRNLVRHLLRLPLAFFEKRHIGDIISRLASLDYIKRMLTEEIISVFIDGTIMGLAFILMLVYSMQLSLVVLGAMLLYTLARTVTYRAFKIASEEALVARGLENSSILESIRGIQSIKLYGGEGDRLTVWMRLFTKMLNADIRAQKARLYGITANRLLFGLENLLVIYLGALQVLNHQLTVGVFVAFLAYKTQFVEKMAGLIEKAFDFRLLSLHMDRLADIILQKQEPIQQGHNELVLSGNLSAKGLSYRYSPQEPYIFKDLSLEVKAGESIAIVGPSGSGKTTLLKILLGLLDADTGEITVDGFDIRAIQANFRKQIATVMQDDRLLTGSIAENIAFFDSTPDFEHIVHCATLACIHTEVLAMTMGYHSLVSDFGSGLSGGQKQRILLARALYRKPKILLLDEATSNLDVDLERAINAAVRDLNITRIIIAHRPETIASAHRVVRLWNGQLQEHIPELKAGASTD